MSKQTAMQEMHDWLNEKWSDPGKLISCFEVMNKIEELLPKEKQQIVQAVDSVQLVQRYYYNDGTFGDDLIGKEVSAGSEREYFALSTTGEQYYKENYNNGTN
jgi:hypothetical protein